MDLFTDIPEMPQDVRWYNVHGTICRIVSNHQDIFPLIDATLGYFSCSEIISPSSLTLGIYHGSSLKFLSDSPCSPWKRAWKTPDVSCYTTGENLLFEYAEKGFCMLNITQGYSRIYLKTPLTFEGLRQMCREMVLPYLFLMMQAKGVARIHAAAASFQGQGIVIAGTSGQGKTTLLLQLLREGLGYMADDAVLLRMKRDSPEVLSFPATIGVSTRTAMMFPELRAMIQRILPDNRGKYRIDFSNIYTRQPVGSAFPSLLMFPEVTPDEKTAVSPLSKTEAAMLLLPENMFVSKFRVSKQNFQVLARFLQVVRCYRVRLGQSMDSVGQHIIEQL